MLDTAELTDSGPIALRYAVRHCHVWVNAGVKNSNAQYYLYNILEDWRHFCGPLERSLITVMSSSKQGASKAELRLYEP
jgi:hypothetical protein